MNVSLPDCSISGRNAKYQITVRFLSCKIELDEGSSKPRNSFINIVIKNSRLVTTDRSTRGKVTDSFKLLSSPSLYFSGKAQILIYRGKIKHTDICVP